MLGSAIAAQATPTEASLRAHLHATTTRERGPARAHRGSEGGMGKYAQKLGVAGGRPCLSGGSRMGAFGREALTGAGRSRGGGGALHGAASPAPPADAVAGRDSEASSAAAAAGGGGATTACSGGDTAVLASATRGWGGIVRHHDASPSKAVRATVKVAATPLRRHRAGRKTAGDSDGDGDGGRGSEAEASAAKVGAVDSSASGIGGAPALSVAAHDARSGSQWATSDPPATSCSRPRACAHCARACPSA